VCLAWGLLAVDRTLALPFFHGGFQAGGSVMEMAAEAGFLAELFASKSSGQVSGLRLIA